MNLHDIYLQKLNEISGLYKGFRNQFKFSDTLLFREHQTILFQWKRALNNEVGGGASFSGSKSFHNLFLDLSPEWKNEIFSLELVTDDLTRLGFQEIPLHFRHFNGFFLCMYLNWEIFKGYPEITKFSWLPHPYEAVFKIVIRGGSIFSYKGVIDIDDRAYIYYDGKFRLPSTDDKFLDFIDERCTDYPNQEKVNQLWADFQKIYNE